MSLNDHDSKQLSLSEDEIIFNAIIMLIAGIETTTTALQFAIHHLVDNVDVQKQLRTDLQNAVKTNGGKLEIKILSGVPLLLNVIQFHLHRI